MVSKSDIHLTSRHKPNRYILALNFDVIFSKLKLRKFMSKHNFHLNLNMKILKGSTKPGTFRLLSKHLKHSTIEAHTETVLIFTYKKVMSGVQMGYAIYNIYI